MTGHQQYPILKYLVFFFMLSCLIAIILIGGGSEDSIVIPGLKCGSTLYWTIYILSVPMMGAFTFIAGWKLYREESEYINPLVPKENVEQYGVVWTLRNLIFWPIVSIMAGFSAALIGIGGGTIQGPVLLEMGLSPQVAVVTSAFMITFTAIANILQYFLLKLISWQHALWYMVVGLIAAMVGHIVVGLLVEKFKKQFFISCLLLVLVMLSFTGLLYQIIERFANHEFEFKFSPLCHNKTVNDPY